MKLTVDNFFKEVQNRLPECDTFRPCLDPTKHENIGELFNKFLSKHNRFGDCTPLTYTFRCPASDGTNDILVLEPDPARSLRMSIFYAAKEASDLKKVEYPHVETLHCKPTYAYTQHFQPYTCSGRLDISDRRPYFGSDDHYELSENYYQKKTICAERYGYLGITLPLATANFNCKGLPLFDKFLKASISEEISLASRALSYTKIGASIGGALFCGYKTYREIQKIWKAAHPKSGHVEDSSKMKQQKATIETAKKRALLFGAATVASLIFTGIFYRIDFANVYHTTDGKPFRFKDSL